MNGRLRALAENIIGSGLPEIAVSHPAEWGIDVPIDNFKAQRIYVWFEMAAGYLAAGGNEHAAGAWRTQRRVVQFFGVDNGYFHTLLFPAIIRAFDANIPLPTAFVTNEFYRLDGIKFSTSRSHAIWLSEALESIPADHLRLYLSWDRPTVSQTNFRWKHFYARVHEELLPRWYSWLTSLARRSKTAASLMPHASENIARPPAITKSRHEWIKNALERVHEAYSLERFSPRTALRQLDLLVEAAAEAGRDSEHLAAHPPLHAAFVREVVDELATAVALAIGLFPIAPMMAGQLWRTVGCSGRVEDARWSCPEAYLPRTLTSLDVEGVGSLFAPAGPIASQGRAE
jgi:methionyl-tRNA synthetase